MLVAIFLLAVSFSVSFSIPYTDTHIHPFLTLLRQNFNFVEACEKKRSRIVKQNGDLSLFQVKLSVSDDFQIGFHMAEALKCSTLPSSAVVILQINHL